MTARNAVQIEPPCLVHVFWGCQLQRYDWYTPTDGDRVAEIMARSTVQYFYTFVGAVDGGRIHTSLNYLSTM